MTRTPLPETGRSLEARVRGARQPLTYGRQPGSALPAPNVSTRAYGDRVAPGPDYPPLPSDIDPDVLETAVRVVRHTLLRHADRGPLDEYVARLLVGLLAEVLAEPAADPRVAETAAAAISEYTAATGAVVVLQARQDRGRPVSR